MNLNTQAVKRINEKIRKLEALREMANDAEMLELFCDLVGAEPNGKSHRSGRKHGSFVRAVLGAVQAASKPVAVQDVLAALEAKNYKFESAKPAVAISRTLGRLAVAKKIKVVKEGKPKHYDIG